VLIDQRGTGGSNGLSCDLYGETQQSHLGDLFPLGAIKACKAEWERRADLRLYTTPIAMDDLDDVRAALGQLLNGIEQEGQNQPALHLHDDRCGWSASGIGHRRRRSEPVRE
jgi:hypothetical protein